MTKINYILGFRIVGVYDVLLGLAFIFFYTDFYQALEITMPTHPAYVYVPALFVMCGGIGEFLIARNPLRNTDLVIVRLLMKLSFASVIFYYYFTSGIPTIFVLISIMSIIGIVKNLAFLNWAKAQA
jgi:hypothetical protein